MWSHPHITLASYTKEHPTNTSVVVRCQTTGAISANQGLVESLEITRLMMGAVSEAMDAAVAQWRASSSSGVPGEGGGAEPMEATSE